MTHKTAMAAKRAYNDALRAQMPSTAKFSGPQVDVFLEGWALVGWNIPRKGHYWRRFGSLDLMATCGIVRPIQYEKTGGMMIFEVGNFDRCSKCALMRSRASKDSGASQ